MCPTLGEEPGAALPPPIALRRERLQEIVAQRHRAGAVLVAGSDAGIVHKPHDVLPHSILALADVGLRNLDALRAATSVAADACGVGDRKGTLAAGMDADIIAVAGDPLRDLIALLDVRAVMRAGKWQRGPRDAGPRGPVHG